MRGLSPLRVLAFARAVFAFLLGLVVLTAPIRSAEPAAPLPDGLYAEITTPRGVVTCELFFRQTPLTVTSFVGLAEGTLGPAPRKPFFDGLKFHRVVADFVVQGGDPLGTGRGGPGYRFPDEIVPGLRHDAIGTLSMANEGPDTNGSQFFLTLRDTTRLNYLHSVFGRTVRGLEVLPQIRQDDAMTVKILRIGAAARAFRADDVAFATLTTKTKKYTGAAEPGPAAHFDDPDTLLPTDPPRAKAFNYKLANFERATGIKIVARLAAKGPPPAEDEKAGAYMHALATKLGVAQRGILVAYFTTDDDWRVWIGDELTAKFTGHPNTASDLAEGGALHKVKEAFLDGAQARGKADYAAQQKASPPDRQPPPQQLLKLQVDAVLDGLIAKFESK